ncbi:MAG TPA: DinB family protein [Polyangiaceae bacterium]|nr:DinB family protein [Polyangiaceae bacterium]
MDAVTHARAFAVNNAWSNLRLYRACLALSKDEFDAARTSFFPSIPRTLNHILIVDWYYLDALEGGGKGRALLENEVPFPAVDALWAAQREVDKRLVAFTERLENDASLDVEVRIPRRDHVQVERAGDVLMHLGTHQIHHRGQVHAMLAGTSVKPPQLDDFFLRGDLPLRETELRELGLPIR